LGSTETECKQSYFTSSYIICTPELHFHRPSSSEIYYILHSLLPCEFPT
jgi:hypothetical protein